MGPNWPRSDEPSIDGPEFGRNGRNLAKFPPPPRAPHRTLRPAQHPVNCDNACGVAPPTTSAKPPHQSRQQKLHPTPMTAREKVGTPNKRNIQPPLHLPAQRCNLQPLLEHTRDVAAKYGPDSRPQHDESCAPRALLTSAAPVRRTAQQKCGGRRHRADAGATPMGSGAGNRGHRRAPPARRAPPPVNQRPRQDTHASRAEPGVNVRKGRRAEEGARKREKETKQARAEMGERTRARRQRKRQRNACALTPFCGLAKPPWRPRPTPRPRGCWGQRPFGGQLCGAPGEGRSWG